MYVSCAFNTSFPSIYFDMDFLDWAVYNIADIKS